MEEKKDEQYFINVITSKTKTLLEKKENSFKEEIFDWVIEKILLSDKYEVDYSNDPYWDRSGEVLLSENKYDKFDYATLEVFFQEYNGSSSPSYESGCGMYHDYYSKDLDEWVMEFVYDIFTEVLTTMIQEDEDFKKWAIEVLDDSMKSETELIHSLRSYLYDSEIDDFLDLEVRSPLFESIYQTDMETLFEERENIVVSYFDEEEKEQLKRREEYEILLEKLNEKHGKKIVSISTDFGHGQSFHIENGEITSHRRHTSETYGRQFKMMILNGMKTGAGMTVRQVTPLKIEVENEGEIQMIPISKISGIRLGNNSWECISKKEMEIAHCTDSETGERIPKESAIQYVSFDKK